MEGLVVSYNNAGQIECCWISFSRVLVFCDVGINRVIWSHKSTLQMNVKGSHTHSLSEQTVSFLYVLTPLPFVLARFYICVYMVLYKGV